MSDQFLAEIRMFAFGFAPRSWAVCNGQLMPISQNTALFSLLGTTYGGDGKTTFALPDLQGSAALHVGRLQPGPGLSIYDLGQQSGTEAVTLLQSEMPMHSHGINVSTVNGTLPSPTGNQLAPAFSGNREQNFSGLIWCTDPGNLQMSPQTLQGSGGNQPHNNMMPSLVLNFCIALQGIFPPRG